ncbi:hypothetical protein K438DRAFT_1957688 [Mycena galopus ATCC 62051]|nr:hypothetical protein K438DRAFT_1957688 [Mycena galopus ATCC 62051]
MGLIGAHSIFAPLLTILEARLRSDYTVTGAHRPIAEECLRKVVESAITQWLPGFAEPALPEPIRTHSCPESQRENTISWHLRVHYIALGLLWTGAATVTHVWAHGPLPSSTELPALLRHKLSMADLDLELEDLLAPPNRLSSQEQWVRSSAKGRPHDVHQLVDA